MVQSETPRLKAVVSHETASPKFLFELVSPTGKASDAHKFKNSLLITGGSSAGRLENSKKIAPEALEFDVSKIEEIRELIKLISLGVSVIITQAQNLTPEAQNALLKTLEEPPENVTIILLAEKESQLLPTVVSRCVISHLSNLSGLDSLKSTSQEQEIFSWMEDGNIQEGFAWAEKAAKDRKETISLLQKLQIIGHKKLLSGAIKAKKLEQIIQTQKFLEANVNTRLALENLFLN